MKYFYGELDVCGCRIIEKGADFSTLTDEFLKEVKLKLNNRPRKSLGFLTPLEYFKKKYKFDFSTVALLS